MWRPDARLFLTRSSRPMNHAGSFPRLDCVRFGQASSNRTASIDIRMSTRSGGCPIDKRILPVRIARGQPRERRAKLGKGVEYAAGVLLAGRNPHVQTLGVPRLRVEHHSITTNHEILNAAGGESFQ